MRHLFFWIALAVSVLHMPAAASKLSQSIVSYPLPDAVRVNPFARPLVVVPKRESREARVAPSQPNYKLRGVLAAGKSSFANVDGTIIGLGEKIGDLTLVSVADESAVFSRGSSRLTLTVSRDPVVSGRIEDVAE